MENALKTAPPVELKAWAQSKEVTSNVITITPEIAAQMLKLSKGNRHINMQRVRNYADAMKHGEFTLSNDAICFDTNGILVNGHHRLTACVRSGVSFRALVNRNMPEESIYDRGLTRSVADALGMNGSIPKELANTSSVALANRYLEIVSGTSKIQVEYLMRDFLNENSENILKATHISELGGQRAPKRHNFCRRAAVQVAIFAALKSGVEEDKLISFAKTANSGFAESNEQSAAIVLRNYILTTDTINGAVAANKLCAVAQLAIQDYVNGKPRRMMYTKLSFPYIPDAKVKFAVDADTK